MHNMSNLEADGLERQKTTLPHLLARNKGTEVEVLTGSPKLRRLGKY